MARTPTVGETPPDFTLPSIHLVDGEIEHRTVTLSQQQAPVVLAFYPGDDTTVCTKQLCSYSSGLEQFTGLGATVWGISTQGLDSHEAFARKWDLRMPLLADTDRTTVDAYGITLGALTRRAVFVIDAAGILRWKHVAAVGLTFRDIGTLTGQLARLTA